MSQIALGDVTVWDFGFRYNLPLMDLTELEVLMIKYEVELRRTNRDDHDQYFKVTGILGSIYREIVNRRMLNKISEIENDRRKIG